MTTLKCVCTLNRKQACEACFLLAERESVYESNVELDYDPQLSLDVDSIEHAAWLESIVLDESQTYHALHDYGDNLPDYC